MDEPEPDAEDWAYLLEDVYPPPGDPLDVFHALEGPLAQGRRLAELSNASPAYVRALLERGAALATLAARGDLAALHEDVTELRRDELLLFACERAFLGACTHGQLHVAEYMLRRGFKVGEAAARVGAARGRVVLDVVVAALLEGGRGRGGGWGREASGKDEDEDEDKEGEIDEVGPMDANTAKSSEAAAGRELGRVAAAPHASSTSSLEPSSRATFVDARSHRKAKAEAAESTTAAVAAAAASVVAAPTAAPRLSLSPPLPIEGPGLAAAAAAASGEDLLARAAAHFQRFDGALATALGDRVVPASSAAAAAAASTASAAESAEAPPCLPAPASCVVHWLVRRAGADPNCVRESDGYSALHLACLRGHAGLAAALLLAGADASAVAGDGSTPLSCAALGRRECAAAAEARFVSVVAILRARGGIEHWREVVAAIRSPPGVAVGDSTSRDSMTALRHAQGEGPIESELRRHLEASVQFGGGGVARARRSGGTDGPVSRASGAVGVASRAALAAAAAASAGASASAAVSDI